MNVCIAERRLWLWVKHCLGLASKEAPTMPTQPPQPKPRRHRAATTFFEMP